MTTTSTSLLQTALQNLHVSQQVRRPSRPESTHAGNDSSSSRDVSSASSGGEEDEDELVIVGQNTRSATPMLGQKGLVLGQRLPGSHGGKAKDPVGIQSSPKAHANRLTDVRSLRKLRTLPTHLSVRVFLRLDIRSLARCERVCKRWRNSSTLNYGVYVPHTGSLRVLSSTLSLVSS